MNTFFTRKDNKEGNVGIGKCPDEIKPYLNNIIDEYNKHHNNEKEPYLTKHVWSDDMNNEIKSNFDKIRKNGFWNNLCENKCIIKTVPELDEIMYSFAPANLNIDVNTNLYGDTNAFQKHIDCDFCNFDKIKFYRVLLGLTDNEHVTTVFNNLNLEHKIQKYDYMIFDFGKTTHQVLTKKEGSSPRVFIKLHFLVSEDNSYSDFYLWCVKQYHVYYYKSMRNLQNETGGRHPTTFKEFFFGLMAHFYYNLYTKYFIFFIIIILIFILNYLFKIKLLYKNVKKISIYLLISLILLYLSIVLFYWSRYKLFGIR
jgi:hypothetical protein